jgi:hypothetical protein
VIITIGTNIVQLEIVMRQDLSNALGVSIDRISIAISVAPSPSSLGLHTMDATTQQANVQILFKADTSSTSSTADEQCQSARSLAMSFASQVTDTNSSLTRAFTLSGKFNTSFSSHTRCAFIARSYMRLG